MPECEFKAICVYDEDLKEKKNCSWEPDSVNDCPHHKYFKFQHELILNSPQFKKQYAKREELVEAIEEFQKVYEDNLKEEYRRLQDLEPEARWPTGWLKPLPPWIVNIIRTHGLEE